MTTATIRLGRDHASKAMKLYGGHAGCYPLPARWQAVGACYSESGILPCGVLVKCHTTGAHACYAAGVLSSVDERLIHAPA